VVAEVDNFMKRRSFSEKPALHGEKRRCRDCMRLRPTRESMSGRVVVEFAADLDPPSVAEMFARTIVTGCVCCPPRIGYHKEWTLTRKTQWAGPRYSSDV